MVDISSFLLKAGVTLALTVNVAKAQTVQLPTYDPPLIAGYVTAYCDTGVTATGTNTRKGICASSQNRLGCTIALYKRLPDNSVGDFIGYFECEDTGGSPGLNNGTVIDVWKSEEELDEFIDFTYEDNCHGNIYIQVFENVGG